MPLHVCAITSHRRLKLLTGAPDAMCDLACKPLKRQAIDLTRGYRRSVMCQTLKLALAFSTCACIVACTPHAHDIDVSKAPRHSQLPHYVTGMDPRPLTAPGAQGSQSKC